MRIGTVSLGILLGIFAVSCSGPESADPGEWPRFRGPGGSGVTSAAGLPVSWDDSSSNIQWRTEVPGSGNSSPIVSHGRIFLTTGEKAGKEVERIVLAYDLETGAELWRTPLGKAPAGKKHRLNSYAAPTPATDGDRVFAFFGDVLASLDRQGGILWQKEIDPVHADFVHYGSASSLVLTEKAVIVAQDKEIPEKPTGWLAAFDQNSGEELWRSSWSETCCSYTTPLVRRRGSTEEVIFAQAGAINSYAADTGDLLWSHPLQINQPVASPLSEGDLLVVFSGAHNVREGAVLRLSGEGRETEVEVLWETNQIIPQTASPVLYEGRLCMVVTKGVLVCYDINTGRTLWRKRLGGKGGYHTSLVAGDGKIYVGNRAGSMLVLESADGYRQLASNQLGEAMRGSPAFAGSTLVIRTASGLLRIGGAER